MEFEWNPAKRISNIEKHGVDFREAARIFEGSILTQPDTRRDYGEERHISIGMFDGTVYIVTHTERGGRIRIISAWKGGRKEHEIYRNAHS